MSENSHTEPGSWYCQKCGIWVPAGVYHVCGHSEPANTFGIDNHARIIKLLEKILEELRRINE